MPGYITGYIQETIISDSAQKRALQNYRSRLSKRGMARFEVLALGADRELIRSLAKRLAKQGAEAEHLRASVRLTIMGAKITKGGILEALRRSPLVGADLATRRSRGSGRKVLL